MSESHPSHPTHGHSHSHDHGHRSASFRALRLALVVTGAYTLAEALGGWWTGSLALLADAGHMLSDVGSLALSLAALWIARRPGGTRHTYGYHRTEILAALVHALTLASIAILISVEAWHRLVDPPAVRGLPMLLVAVGGLVVNLVALRILHSGKDESLNLRGAWLHVLTDTLGSVQAIAAGALIWAFGWRWADPAASFVISALVLFSSWPLLRDAVRVLMEVAPDEPDPDAVHDALAAVDGVVDVHDLHLWTVTSGFDALTVHVRAPSRDPQALLADLRAMLRERFGLEHSTIQIEGDEPCLQDEDCGQ